MNLRACTPWPLTAPGGMVYGAVAKPSTSALPPVSSNLARQATTAHICRTSSGAVMASTLPYSRPAEHAIGELRRTPAYVIDTRDEAPDMFVDASATDWSRLTWKDVKRPYRVERWAEEKRAWEAANGGPLPVQDGWKKFNANFHHLFTQAPADESRRARAEIVEHLAHADVHGAWETVQELVRLAVWNRVHRVEDAVWDPRGKRVLFGGLELKRPRVLFL